MKGRDRGHGAGGLSLKAIKLHSSFAIHPGAWLKTAIVEPHGLNVTVAAKKLGVTRQALSNLLNGHAELSAEMAIRFEKAFRVRADTMLRMQAAHDPSLARDHEKDIKVERVVAKLTSPSSASATPSLISEPFHSSHRNAAQSLRQRHFSASSFGGDPSWR